MGQNQTGERQMDQNQSAVPHIQLFLAYKFGLYFDFPIL